MLKDVTREMLGFQGIIITDDMIMQGVQHLPFNTPTLTKMALEAGNDIILISRTPELHEKIYISLMNDMENDSDFRETVKDSALRVILTKLEYLKGPDAVPLYPDKTAVAQLIPIPEGKDFFVDHAFRSVTTLRGTTPMGEPDKMGKVLLTGQYQSFFQAGESYFPEADTYSFPYSPFYYAKNDDIAKFNANTQGYDTIIFCLANPNSLEMLTHLEDFEGEVIILSVLTPIYLNEVPWIDKALALYGTSDASFQAGFSALVGEFEPQGVLPINQLSLEQ